MEGWTVSRLNEDEKHRLLKVLTSLEILHQLTMEKCITRSVTKGTIWPEVIRKALPEHAKNDKEVNSLVHWLSKTATNQKKFTAFLETIINEHSKHCALWCK